MRPSRVVVRGLDPEGDETVTVKDMGEGRLLACFYAHEDKLSGQCQYALYDAASQLDAAVNALNYVATQCHDDILAHCAEVQVGEGRVLECLNANSASVSDACKQAVKDVTE